MHSVNVKKCMSLQQFYFIVVTNSYSPVMTIAIKQPSISSKIKTNSYVPIIVYSINYILMVNVVGELDN